MKGQTTATLKNTDNLFGFTLGLNLLPLKDIKDLILQKLKNVKVEDIKSIADARMNRFIHYNKIENYSVVGALILGTLAALGFIDYFTSKSLGFYNLTSFDFIFMGGVAFGISSAFTIIARYVDNNKSEVTRDKLSLGASILFPLSKLIDIFDRKKEANQIEEIKKTDYYIYRSSEEKPFHKLQAQVAITDAFKINNLEIPEVISNHIASYCYNTKEYRPIAKKILQQKLTRQPIERVSEHDYNKLITHVTLAKSSEMQGSPLPTEIIDMILVNTEHGSINEYSPLATRILEKELKKAPVAYER